MYNGFPPFNPVHATGVSVVPIHGNIPQDWRDYPTKGNHGALEYVNPNDPSLRDYTKGKNTSGGLFGLDLPKIGFNVIFVLIFIIGLIALIVPSGTINQAVKGATLA